MGGIVNGVDQLYSNNEKPGLIAQVFVQPVSGWNVYVNGITANRNTKNATTGITDDGTYNLLDLTTTYQISEKFLLGLNAATGKQSYAVGDSKTWGGFAVYPKYDFSSTFSLGARYESFSNTNAVTGLVIPAVKDDMGNEITPAIGVSVTSFTITPSFTVADSHLILKPELRIDTYDKNFFVDGDGKDTKSQATLGLAMIYKF